MNRLWAAVLFLSLSPAFAVPSVRRVICADDFVAGGFYRIELEVSHPGALPGAMVVSEDWPDGFEIIDGYWGGVRFRPVERSGVYSWLFGPELALAAYLSENYPDEQFYIIKYAIGGTAMDTQWNATNSSTRQCLDELEAEGRFDF